MISLYCEEKQSTQKIFILQVLKQASKRSERECVFWKAVWLIIWHGNYCSLIQSDHIGVVHNLECWLGFLYCYLRHIDNFAFFQMRFANRNCIRWNLSINCIGLWQMEDKNISSNILILGHIQYVVYCTFHDTFSSTRTRSRCLISFCSLVPLCSHILDIRTHMTYSSPFGRSSESRTGFPCICNLK